MTVVQKEEDLSRSAISTFRAKEEEIEHKKMETQSEITNGAETSASKELVAYDLPDPWNSIPLSGPSDKSIPQTYPERVRNIMGAKRSRNYSKKTPCKRKLCYGYLDDGEHDKPIDVEPRSTASVAVPVVLLPSRSKYKRSNNL